MSMSKSLQPTTAMATTRTYSLNFIGDVMLGRLVDQLFPQHVNNADDEQMSNTFKTRYPHLKAPYYTHRSPWGSTLQPLLHTSDLNLINLETSATTTSSAWPHKTFNYRMHPANLRVLQEGRVDFAALANNHSLDFGTDGLVETIWGVQAAGVRFAGVGETTDDCRRPAVLELPRRGIPNSVVHGDGGNWSDMEKHGGHGHERRQIDHEGDGEEGREGEREGGRKRRYKIHVYSASDHPQDWAIVPTFHLIDYSPGSRGRLKTLLTNSSSSSSSSTAARDKPALKIFSIHWGPNYTWQPAGKIRSLAHFLIDECGVDIVYGHSAHHIQGVERYRGKLILYGCGDFVDDYALNRQYRNDLGAVWRVIVRDVDHRGGDGGPGLVLDRLEVFPTRCDRFQATLLDTDDEDHGWVRRKITALSEDMGTRVSRNLGEDGQIVVDLQV